MESQEIKHHTRKQTAELLNVSVPTIARTKKKAAYRQLVLDALEQKGVTAATVADSLKDLMKAEKVLVVKDEGCVRVDDNITRFNATAKVGDIMGVDAPKEFDLKHTMAAMGDDELQDAVNQSAKEINGKVQHRITGTPNAEAAITNTVANAESAMVEQPGKQAVGPTDS
jgi:hypothetical protein